MEFIFNPEEVKGFEKLNENLRTSFSYTAKKFLQAQGYEYKEERTPVSVKFLKKENAFRVDLADKSWQYFYLNGTWG